MALESWTENDLRNWEEVPMGDCHVPKHWEMKGLKNCLPPPDVAPGNVAPCDLEGGTWSGRPMPSAPMKSETSSKLVEIGA